MSDQMCSKAEDYLYQFGDYLRSVGMARNTIESYGRDVKQFLKFLEDEGVDIQDVDEEVLLRSLRKLTERELTNTTKRRMMEGVKTFFWSMKRTGQVRENPFADFDDMPKVKDKNIRVLTEMAH